MGIATIPLAAGSLLMLVAAFIQAVCGSILRDRAKMYRVFFDPRREYTSFRQEFWYAFWRNMMWLVVVAGVVIVPIIIMIIGQIVNFYG